MKFIITAHDAYELCEGIAESRALATTRSEYGDGYRAAAEHIAAAIRARRIGAPPSQLERDLRDAEIEARTFARVIEAAVCVMQGAGEQTEAADALRELVHSFFADGDLPPLLRNRDRSSTIRIAEQTSGKGTPARAIGSRARATAGGSRRPTMPPFDPAV